MLQMDIFLRFLKNGYIKVATKNLPISAYWYIFCKWVYFLKYMQKKNLCVQLDLVEQRWPT